MNILCGLEGIRHQDRIMRRKEIMRNFVLTAAAVLALGLVACGEKDEDTGDTSVEEVVDTAGEETE